MLLSKPRRGFIYDLRACVLVILVALLVHACSRSDDALPNPNTEPETGLTDTLSLKILSLGDSYTIGTGVCDTCSYPLQLIDRLAEKNIPVYQPSIEIIATSGWTTANLLSAINNRDPDNTFDLVTLLIGVNNQFQGRPFEQYEVEFSELLDIAVSLAGNRTERVIVLSIPDYAYSPFGQNWGNPATTSMEIDLYNSYAEWLCFVEDISFLNITDISREGLDRPELIAEDGLHLSEVAYAEIVERLLPVVCQKLEMD